jgi:hypothetical protein
MSDPAVGSETIRPRLEQQAVAMQQGRDTRIASLKTSPTG